mmetsp:Transcript_9998/g.24649  ORF Transcript_9998/g.24649 Transcript_9998/m.24649 type:complete len:221 (+) Transcript_9998:208-870(+)
MPTCANTVWLFTRHCSFAAASLAAISAATESASPAPFLGVLLALLLLLLLFLFSGVALAELADTSSVTVSSAQSRLAAFCAGSGVRDGACTFRDTMAGICCRKELSRKKDWLEGEPRSRLLHSSRQSCTMMPPSDAPSSRMMLKHRSNAPSNATILRRSSEPWLTSEMSSSSVSLRITSRSSIMSMRRPTPMGLDMMASCTWCALVADSAVSSCTVWYRM